MFFLAIFRMRTGGETTCPSGKSQNERTLSFRCQQYIGPLTSGLLAITAFISPILMVALPHLGVFDSKIRKINLDCDVTCDGMLISFAFKLLILLIGTSESFSDIQETPFLEYLSSGQWCLC